MAEATPHHNIDWGQHVQFLRDNWLALGPEGCAARLAETLGRPVSVHTVKSAATRLRNAGYAIPCIPHGAGVRRSVDLPAEIRHGREHWTADDTHEIGVTVSQLIRTQAQRTGARESLVAVEIMHAALHAAMKAG
jgi:hypothetical protein